jgi:hypothetical protein
MKKYIVLICLLATQLISLLAKEDSIVQKAREAVALHNQKAIAKLEAEQMKRDSIMRENTRENTLKNAEFVFEGVVKYDSAYVIKYNSVHRVNYDSEFGVIAYSIVDIKKVYKGNISPGTVKVVTLLDNEYEIYSSGVPNDSIAIFFCKTATRELKESLHKGSDKNNNLQILGGYNELISVGWNTICFSEHAKPRGLGMDFKNKAEVYKFLQGYPGLNVPDYKEPPYVRTPCADCAKVNVRTAAYRDSIRLVRKKQYENFPEKKKQKRINNTLKSASVTTDVNFNITNFKYTPPPYTKQNQSIL